MSDLRAVTIAMPLCRSSQGIPLARFSASQSAIDYGWDGLEPFIRRQVVEHFEGARKRHHGGMMQLPTLDPDAWLLVPTDKVNNCYELRLATDQLQAG